MCIPSRRDELRGGDADLSPCTSAGTHQVVCECKILPMPMHPTCGTDLWEGSSVKPKEIQALSECSFCLTRFCPAAQPEGQWASLRQMFLPPTTCSWERKVLQMTRQELLGEAQDQLMTRVPFPGSHTISWPLPLCRRCPHSATVPPAELYP